MTIRLLLSGLLGALALTLPITACGQSQAPVMDAPVVDASDDDGAVPSALTNLIADYDTVVVTKDYGRLIDLSMPDRLLNELAASEGITDVDVEEVRDGVVTEISAVMNQLESFEYTMASPIGIPQTTPTGRDYYLLPTEVRMQFEGQKVKATGSTLAISDEGKWFLVNPSDTESIGLIKAAFPDFEAIEIPTNKMELIK